MAKKNELIQFAGQFQSVVEKISRRLEAKETNVVEVIIYLAQSDAEAEFDGIVWEALRFVPIAPYLFRKSASDYTVGMSTDYATKIPAGSVVLPATQSAMFDPRAFENPDEFNPHRNWYNHFNFGFGSHECLGRYVGMVMIPEMVRQVLLRNKVSATGSIDYKSGPFPEEYRLSWE